jgi:hypothetical protein
MAFLNEIAELYRAYGLKTRMHPRLKGGKHSDMAVKHDGTWVYFEVKTRYNSVIPIRERQSEAILGLQREIRRAARHAIQQLPAKRASMILVRTSPIPARRKLMFYKTVTRQALTSFFTEAPKSLSAVYVLMPIRRQGIRRYQTARFMVTAVPNPKHRDDLARKTFNQILTRYFAAGLLSQRSVR